MHKKQLCDIYKGIISSLGVKSPLKWFNSYDATESNMQKQKKFICVSEDWCYLKPEATVSSQIVISLYLGLEVLQLQVLFTQKHHSHGSLSPA